jgi:uncharacterized protein (DUF2141 family)
VGRIGHILLAAAAALLSAAPAAARQPLCGDRAELIDHLRDRYGVVEILASAEISAWTILVIKPSGRACAIVAGQAWQEMDWTSLDPEA